jgi:hypothetical protein
MKIMTNADGTTRDTRDPEETIRNAHDAEDNKRLKRNPADEDAKLDVALDETFPSSDAPSNTQPGKGKDPPPSSGYDEKAERIRERAHATD